MMRPEFVDELVRDLEQIAEQCKSVDAGLGRLLSGDPE
jgi:hypothetical protein